MYFLLIQRKCKFLALCENVLVWKASCHILKICWQFCWFDEDTHFPIELFDPSGIEWDQFWIIGSPYWRTADCHSYWGPQLYWISYSVGHAGHNLEWPAWKPGYDRVVICYFYDLPSIKAMTGCNHVVIRHFYDLPALNVRYHHSNANDDLKNLIFVKF